MKNDTPPSAAPGNETPAPKSAPTPKRKYRYIGQPTNALNLPNLSGVIDPNTVDEAYLETLLRRYPSMCQLFELV